MQATRLKAIRRRVTVPEKVLKEFHMVRSEAWEVMADLVRIAFGTPMFSQRPDRGYQAQRRSIHSRISVSESSESVGTRDISGGSHRLKPLSVTVQFATFGSPAIIFSSSTDATLSPLTLIMVFARSMRWTLPYCITTAL